MIRINLLAVERERVRKRVVLIPAAHRVTIGATVILVGTAALIGWWFLMLRQQSAQLDIDLAQAETETRQIRSVLEQVRKFESQKAVLQQRVTLIEQLRKGQYAPVHLLDEVSKSLPDRLWLSDLTQTGAEFTIGGMTDSLTAVSDFVANLEGTRWFKKPVEILDSQVQADAKAGDLIKFQIKAQFVDPTAPPEAPAKAGPGRGAASAK
jgi:type IV pilus assembly protein PilN